MIRRIFFIKLILALSLSVTGVFLWAGQTGKITGTVTDKNSGEPLIGVNVFLEGKSIGAATDENGYFVILNIPPGEYSLKASMLGYSPHRVTNIRIVADKTTNIDVELVEQAEALGEEVVVIAQREVIKRDLTSSELSVGSKEIKNLPVENLTDILELNAGVVKDASGGIHIRGGRSTEVGYRVDGVSVNDNFSGSGGSAIDIQFIEEVKVISGVFNAEYGQAMSGVVEIITKEGADNFQGMLSLSSGDYISSNKNIFMNIDELDPTDITDIKFNITGPIRLGDKKLSYNLAFRRYEDNGYMYGQRKFNPTDSSFQVGNEYFISATGDNEIVSLNSSLNYGLQAKLSFDLSTKIKLSNLFLYDNSEAKYYNHLFKYNPDGLPTNYNSSFNNIFTLTYVCSPTTFLKLKYSYKKSENKTYVYEDFKNPEYANPELLKQLTAYSFYTGGSTMEHVKRITDKHIVKLDLLSQVNKFNEVKMGVELGVSSIRPENELAYYKNQPSEKFNDNYFLNAGSFDFKPVEAAAYIQDKFEYESIIINAGLRFDYFNSKGMVPADNRDPENSNKNDAEVQTQISPRLGIAFPISADGTVHFSYGHFFQLPPLEYLYANPNFRILPNGTRTLMGNANLKAQSTTAYEIGLHYKLWDVIGVEVIGYYKDIKDLLGTEIVESYVKSDRYALYTNLDYGKTKGLTISINKNAGPNDNVSVSLDYTLQVSESNASDPRDAFNRSQGYPPKKANIQIIPVNWDQRHTINFSLFYGKPENYTIGIIAKYNSGFPYTPENQSVETSFENSARMPNKTNIDLQFNKIFTLNESNISLMLKVYNLFDTKNEINVYRDTGSAGYSLISHYTPQYQGANTLDEFLVRPDFYSSPRKIIFELTYNFKL